MNCEKTPVENVRSKRQIFRNRACCFTGHRPEKLPFGSDEKDERCIAIKTEISRQIIKLFNNGLGVYQFFSGMARGVDMWGIEAVLRLNLTAPQGMDIMETYGLIPFALQSEEWNMDDKLRYLHLIEQMTFCSQLYTDYRQSCFYDRDRRLVDMTSHVIAVFDERSSGRSGTKYTVNYAKKCGRHIILINPKSAEVTEINAVKKVM